MPNFVGAIIATRSVLFKNWYPSIYSTEQLFSIRKRNLQASHAETCMNSAWIFPGKRCLEKLRPSLGVFTLLPALRDEQSTPLVPRWVYLVLIPSLGVGYRSKNQK